MNIYKCNITLEHTKMTCTCNPNITNGGDLFYGLLYCLLQQIINIIHIQNQWKKLYSYDLAYNHVKKIPVRRIYSLIFYVVLLEKFLLVFFFFFGTPKMRKYSVPDRQYQIEGIKHYILD